jgi:hypothetical protein
MKYYLTFLILLTPIPVAAQSPDWRQWQQTNPTYPQGTMPTRSNQITPQKQQVSPPPTQPASQQVPQRSQVLGQVQVMEARLTPNTWINLRVQNLTSNSVSDIWVDYQVSDGQEVYHSNKLKVQANVAAGQIAVDRFPVLNLPSDKSLGQLQIKINKITWVNADGSQGENTQWGQMLFVNPI